MNIKNNETALDESPTDELPVLTEIDVVDLDAGSILLLADQKALDVPAGAGDADLAASTGRFPLPEDLPEIEPFPEPDAEYASLTQRVLALEAALDDKDADIASLAERLRATREAVVRRDETEAQLRAQLAEAASERRQLEKRLAEADALAASYAERVADVTSRLRTLEQTVVQRDSAFTELEAELIAREARVVERERTLAQADAGSAGAVAPEPLAAGTAPDRTRGAATYRGAFAEAAEPAPDLQAALERSRDEAAALAAYIDCRRAHWLALEAQLEEHRTRVRELEIEIEQRAERERREAERADGEVRRADELRSELARLRAMLPAPSPTGSAPAAGPAPASPLPESPDGIPAVPSAPYAVRAEETPTATMRARTAVESRRAMPSATLVCLTSDPPHEYRLADAGTLIGRGPECDIRIATHFVSREHARIYRDRERVIIEDLGSKNGVFVNAVRVERGGLRHGDLVTIGETQFRFEMAPATGFATAAADDAPGG